MPAIKILQRALANVPTSCIACGKTCVRAYSLCQYCEPLLPWTGLSCSGCGIEYDANRLVDGQCGACLTNNPVIDHCRALFNYTSPIRELLTGFKYHAKFEIGYALARLLAVQIENYYQQDKPQLLIPVPLHLRRLRQRGFNQALEIARVAAHECSIPLRPAIVQRVKDTAAQTSLGSARSRSNNMKAAFQVAQQAELENVREVALVDDVVTTMATIKELAGTLKSHGIQRIDVWCLARSQP